MDIVRCMLLTIISTNARRRPGGTRPRRPGNNSNHANNNNNNNNNNDNNDNDNNDNGNNDNGNNDTYDINSNNNIYTNSSR